MTIFSDIEVLEDWLQVNALVLNGLSVFFQELIHASHLIWVGGQVLPSRKKGIVLCDWSNCGLWVLVNSSNCESFVDICYEGSVLEESLWVLCGILVSQEFKFIVSQRKLHA